MKILYVATIGGFMPFFKSLISELILEGHSVDIATNMTDYPLPEYYKDWGCGIYQLSCSRSPLSKGNFKAINEIKNIVNNGHYDIVHCHTPIAAACTRVACRSVRKKGTKVIYTAHGFHFYTGAPLKNWLLFYPIEKICSRWTDVLITINKEDYERANKKFNINRIEYIPGVGIDVKKYSNDFTDRIKKRKELIIPENAYILLSVGELNSNKNHQIVIRAISTLNDKSIHYVIAGKGIQNKELLRLAKELGIESRVHLIGYRTDVSELYKMADLYVLPSLREGLNVSLMEAMSSGLPCIASNIRGNRDLIDDNKGGYLVSPNQCECFAKSITDIKIHLLEYGIYNKNKALMYDQDLINEKVKLLYVNCL